jgi:hypothetical protein
VDESSAQRTDNHGLYQFAPGPTPSSSTNGGTRIPDTSWPPSSYGASPYETFTGSEDSHTTQHSRSSSLYSPPSVPDPPRSQTPESDHTAHIPLVT